MCTVPGAPSSHGTGGTNSNRTSAWVRPDALTAALATKDPLSAQLFAHAGAATAIHASSAIEIGPTVKFAYVDQSRDDLAANKSVWEDVSGGLDLLTVGKFQMPSRAYLGRFNFRGADQQKIVGQLSGGERGRLHLAKTLITGGNVLLLDEPSNDLDVETLRALEDALSEFAGSALVISHDRWFLDRIATHILAAEDNSKWVFFEGNYQEYEADKRKRLGEEGARPHRPRFKPLH